MTFTLTDLAEGDPVELEHVATGTVWFVKPVNPYRVCLGLIGNDGRERVIDLNPHNIEVDFEGGRFLITHTDPEED